MLLSKSLPDNGSIPLLVLSLAGPTEEPLSGLHCTSKLILAISADRIILERYFSVCMMDLFWPVDRFASD